MPKKCLKSECENNVFSSGYCKNHQHLRPAKEIRTPKDRGLFVRDAKPVDNVYQDELNAWFKAREKDIIASGSVCWECGTYLQKAYYRHATAHIFAKSLFPSVATHPLNFIILGAGCGCHNTFDHSIDRASKMKVWKEAKERFLQFKHLIKEKHSYYDLFTEKI